MGVDPCALRAEARAEIAQGSCVCDTLRLPGQVFLTQRLLRILDAAENEALLRREEQVSVGHLLEALLEGRRSSLGND